MPPLFHMTCVFYLFHNLCRERTVARLGFHDVHTCAVLCERYAVHSCVQAQRSHCLTSCVVYGHRSVGRHVDVQHVAYRVGIYVEPYLARSDVIDAGGYLLAVEQLPFAHLSQTRASVLGKYEPVEAVAVVVVEAVELGVLACVEALSGACVYCRPASSVVRALQFPAHRVARSLVVCRRYAVQVCRRRFVSLELYPRITEIVEHELGVRRAVIQFVEILFGVVVAYLRCHYASFGEYVIVRQTDAVYLYVAHHDSVGGIVRRLCEGDAEAFEGVAVGYACILERPFGVEACVRYVGKRCP